MSNPMFSIVVTVYNAEKTLYKCLESVKNQSCGDFECVIINDGSKDKSEDIIKSFLDDKRFIYVYQDNQGTSGATNVALKIVRGNYFVILDHDDWLDDNYLSKSVEIIKKYNPDFIKYAIDFYSPEGSFLFSNSLGKSFFVNGKDNLDEDFLINDEWYFVGHNAKVIRMSLFDDVKYEGHGNGADLFVMHRICIKINSLYYCGDSLYKVTALPTSISRSSNSKDFYISFYDRSYSLLKYYERYKNERYHFKGTDIIYNSYVNAILYNKKRSLNHLHSFGFKIIKCRKMFNVNSYKLLGWAIAPYVVKFCKRIIKSFQ